MFVEQILAKGEGRPDGLLEWDRSCAAFTVCGAFGGIAADAVGDAAVAVAAAEKARRATRLTLVCMPDKSPFRHDRLRRLGFRIKKVARSAWSREDLAMLVDACRSLRCGNAARQENIRDYYYHISKYTFGDSKDPYDVSMEIAKLVSMGSRAGLSPLANAMPELETDALALDSTSASGVDV